MRESRWDDRVGIIICVLTWLIIGMVGMWGEIQEWKLWLSLVM